MAYEEMRVLAGEHRIVLEDREQLTISGVEEVESFDESSIPVSYTHLDVYKRQKQPWLTTKPEPKRSGSNGRKQRKRNSGDVYKRQAY